MKLFIVLLILAGFLQTTIIPFDLMVAILITRSYRVSAKLNLFFGFSAGVMLGILSAQNVGVWALFLLILVYLVQLFKSLPISTNIQTFMLISLACFFITAMFEMLIFNQTFQIVRIVEETILSLVIYSLLSLWEERFIVKPQIRLKIKS